MKPMNPENPLNPLNLGNGRSGRSLPDLVIRSEQPEDYQEINRMTVLAFQHHPYCTEGALTALLRARPGYQAELSLVAASGERIIGHALFNPLTMRIQGEEMAAVLLAPLAVHPDVQRMGIGSRLVSEGHRRAAAGGFRFSFLLGHPGYYPRLGYVSAMFGKQIRRIAASDLPEPPSLAPLEEKRVQESDLPELARLWEIWYGGADFVRKPTGSITDWISTNSRICSVSVWIDNQLVGYLRYDKEQPRRVLTFLARDRESALQLLSLLAARLPAGAPCLELTLPAGDLPLMPLPCEAANERWDAAMLCPLDRKDERLLRYMQEVADGRVLPGPVIWPPEYEGEE